MPIIPILSPASKIAQDPLSVSLASPDYLGIQTRWIAFHEPVHRTAHSVQESGPDLSRAKVVGRGLRKDARLPLSVLREAWGKTQSTVAQLANMDQAEVSRVEHRDDMLVSTLRKYPAALGAELELVAVFPQTGHRIRVDL